MNKLLYAYVIIYIYIYILYIYIYIYVMPFGKSSIYSLQKYD